MAFSNLSTENTETSKQQFKDSPPQKCVKKSRRNRKRVARRIALQATAPAGECNNILYPDSEEQRRIYMKAIRRAKRAAEREVFKGKRREIFEKRQFSVKMQRRAEVREIRQAADSPEERERRLPRGQSRKEKKAVRREKKKAERKGVFTECSGMDSTYGSVIEEMMY